jgi:hypothetical protein
MPSGFGSRECDAARSPQFVSYGACQESCATWDRLGLTDTEIVTSGSLPDACYQRLVAAVERAINEADPIRLLGVGAPPDEYSPEIGTILPRLAGVQGISDVTNVLHEEFVRWFDQRIAGPREAYEASARRIWAALLEYRDVVE